MARETADAEPDGEDGKTQESGTRKAGDANKNTAKVTVSSTGKSSPSIEQVVGLVPVESEQPNSTTDDPGGSIAGKKTSAAQSSRAKDKPLSRKHRRVSPLDSMATVNDSNMCEIDLGDGMDAASTQGKTSASKRDAAKDEQNGNATDKKMDELKPEDAKTEGKDQTDSQSLYSLYMESDFRYYFQHPYARLFTAYFVTFCNFLIYAEDPVAHSRTECNIPVIGNCFAFVGTRYPSNAWSLLKVVLWIAGTIVGMIVGKILVHTLLFNRLFRLKMFSDDKGSWMTMFLTTIVSVFIFAYIYTAFLLIGGDAMKDYHISPYMDISNNIFMKAAATGTWCGDFFTAWMVTDMMLQEKLYPKWALTPRRWWNRGYNRIILFWIVVFISSFVVIFVIATDYINWDSLNRDFLHSNELSRAFLASFILVMDICIVMQDWDFPHFISAIDIKLPGLNTAEINFKIPRLLKKLEYWHVHITGKWFNYGILFVVILLDLNMWKNQIFYAPYDYGQYVDSEGRIHSVKDDYSLDNMNETLFSFSFRNSTIDSVTGKRYIELDSVMNARYNEYSLGVKAIAFIPSIAVFIAFGIFIWVYGRMPKPTKSDPYGGRLQKRRRFRLRLGWKRLRKRFRTTELAVNAFKEAGREAQKRREQEEGQEGADGTDGRSAEAKAVSKWKGVKKENSEAQSQETGTPGVFRQLSSTVV